MTCKNGQKTLKNHCFYYYSFFFYFISPKFFEVIFKRREILIDKKTSINVNNLDEMVSKVANIVDQNTVDLSKETDDFLQTHLIDNIAPKLKNIYDQLIDRSNSKE